MKKFTAIMMALVMVLGLTQCRPDKGNEGDTQNGSKVKVSCVVPINKGAKSEFDNLMTDGTIKWSAGTERIYLAIPDETNPQIVELTAFTTVESNILLFEGEVAEGLVKDGEYEVWYLGNSKNLDIPYVTEEIEDEVIRSISGSIASQSGDLEDLGYCHIAKTTVTAETKGEEVVLSLNGTLKNQIAIAHLNLEGITQLKGDAIVGTEYTLQYVDGAFEFVVTPSSTANITVTEGTTASYVVLLPNATANVDLKSNTSKKVTFECGVEANKIYYKHVSDMEFYPLAWEDYEENLINGHEYVDLGLPSGLLWATCNVGANAPEEYGDYFAWGETETKSEYTQANSLTYGKSLNDISGNPQYDAATANWGGTWRMPTYDELNELLTNCTWTWTTQNGVKGYNVEGPNGNSIFLPAAGYRDGSSLGSAGSWGCYWSSEPYESNSNFAYNLYFDSSFRGMNPNSRFYGQSVRPVCGGNNTTSSNFTEDFNAYDHGISNINGWRIFQYDTDIFNWETSNAYAGYDNTSTCIHSLSYATSFLTPDNFIVTTSKYAITSTSTFSFDASPFSPMYKDDKFGVVISEDNENWTVVYTVIFNSESEYGYVNKSVDLSAYAGKNVYIGFRHYDCGSDNSSGVLVDNIVLSDGSAK